MGLALPHKIYHDGGAYLTTAYVFDAERKACLDGLFERGSAMGLSGGELYGYIHAGFAKRFGPDDWYIPQLDEAIARKLQKRSVREPQPYDAVFDWYFLDALKKGLKGEKQAAYVKDGLLDNFGEFDGIDDYIADTTKRKLCSYHGRRRRFRRKTFLNDWTHFVTVTYDDKRDTPETFRQRLKKCFSNLHTRKGWKYMGVFEYSPAPKNRLHFHALVYIPDGGMTGTVKKVRRFNFEKHRMVDCWENSRFKAEFGINDFSPIEGIEISWRNIANKTVDYILKYMVKNEEKIFYSRAVPECRYEDIDFAGSVIDGIKKELSDFVCQYVLFDDIFDDGGAEPDDIPISPPLLAA
ncbi:MAG: hypothetical protein LBL66_05160 [Clostridiales bacterium]|jgi:hypothetical protein|nr:hypothetical protein [Clostridiales bacterium]